MKNSYPLVIVSLPVLLTGGTEFQTHNLVRSLVNSGYQVKICCYFGHETSMVFAMEEAGARVDLMGLKRSDGLWALLLQLKRFYENEQPDVVHVQYLAPGLIPVLAARLAHVPVVFATVHQPGRTYGLKEKFFLRVAARLCSAFFCNSLSVEKSWFGNSTLFNSEHADIQRHCTIYNAVDVEKIAAVTIATNIPAMRRELGLGSGPVIGCVGRLRQEKGQIFLLEAFAKVVKLHPSAILLLVGDGPDREVLEFSAKRFGIESRTHFAGRCEPEEVIRWLAVMEVVAIPSLFEGFGLVAAEAMAAGKPVVASAVDGLTEVGVDGRTGMLVPPGNPMALADALSHLLNNPPMARGYGAVGLRHCRENFELTRFRDATLAAYSCHLSSQGEAVS